MKYIIEGYDSLKDEFECRDEDGKFWKLDLFTDATFPEAERLGVFTTKEERDVSYRSLIGKTIEAESLSPYIPCYFASNVRFVN